MSERCDYVLPGISVLSVFSANTRRCALGNKHDGEHLFDFPKISGKRSYAPDPKPVSKPKKGKRGK